jgi:signal peptidase I
MALALGLMVRAWLVEGVFLPLAVVSGSMADTLVGLHREVVCGACGQRFAIGTSQGPPPARAVCPNCGYLGIDPSLQPDVPGERVVVDRSAFLLRGPRRFEVVAFRPPDRAAAVFVKRVAGLPGEAVQVCEGDLYVDGRLVRKTLAQQRAVAVLVHDASRPPAAGCGLPRRWQAPSPASLWRVERGKFVHPGGSSGRPADWCQYRHLTHRPGQPDVFDETPIDDQAAYNQGWSRRADDIRPVADLLLSLRVEKHSGPGCLAVKIGDGQRRFTVELDLERNRFTAFVDERANALAVGPIGLHPGRPFQVEVSIVDQQFLAAVDGRLLVEHAFRRTGPARPEARPVAIGVAGPQVEIDEVRLYRDVYYTRPIGVLARWGVDRAYRLGPDEYFVLGDNSPASDDSRSWPCGPGVQGQLLVGKPLAVYFPIHPVRWLGWRFQLPDLSRIRYIR